VAGDLLADIDLVMNVNFLMAAGRVHKLPTE
jgi:hypothetical protein